MMSAARKPILVALAANLLIAVTKYIAAFLSMSAAMLAEAYHSTSDTLNQVFLLWGLRAAKKPPDAKHPFGYGMAGYFWSFVVAMLIFGVAGTLSFVEGIDKLRHPHELHWLQARWAIAALCLAFVFEGYALRVTVQEFRTIQRGLGATTLRDTVRRSKDAALLTILFEDALALAGILLALGGIGLALWTGNGLWDGAASLIIGLMLMVFALVLARRNQTLLLGEAMDPGLQLEIIRVLERMPEVTKVVSLRTMHLAPHNVLAALEVNFRDAMSTDAVEVTIDKIEALIRSVAPDVQHCIVEAEDHDGTPTT